jgi:drug/metabolite transporter (DMT)-like permease
VARASLAGVALVAAGAALWGVDGALRAPLVDDGGEPWSTWTIVLYEHVLLVALAGPFLLLHRDRLRGLSASAWLAALVIAWGGSALATLAFTSAFRDGNPNVVILLQKTQPLFAITAAALVLRERPRPRFALYLVPAGLGAYLLVLGDAWRTPGEALAGGAGRAALLALLAAALWGAGTALGRRALHEVGPVTLAALRFTLALPLLAALAAAESALAPPGGAPGADWVRLPLIALLPGLVAMLLYYRGLRSTPASVATLAELAFPAAALLVNYLALDATISRTQLVGFAVLWATIALLHRAPVELPLARPRLAAARGR